MRSFDAFMDEDRSGVAGKPAPRPDTVAALSITLTDVTSVKDSGSARLALYDDAEAECLTSIEAALAD